MILFLDQSIKKVEAVHFTVLCTTLYSLTLNSDDSGNRVLHLLRQYLWITMSQLKKDFSSKFLTIYLILIKIGEKTSLCPHNQFLGYMLPEPKSFN